MNVRTSPRATDRSGDTDAAPRVFVLATVSNSAAAWPELEEDLVDRTAPVPVEEPAATAKSLRLVRRRILVADDDVAVLEALTSLLESENYEVLQAQDGREAIRRFVRDRPDLVLLDLSMPRRDGWRVLEAIDQKEPFVPVIIITARPDQGRRASSLGVDALMEKPLDFPLLLRTIADLLREARSERIARLTQMDFVTRRLPSGASTPSAEASSELPT